MTTYIAVGDLRRRSLNIPKHFSRTVRPTTSLVRSALFNILLHNQLFANLDFSQISVADLFCGSGVVGIEFLSLGAKKCSFFDKEMGLLQVLRGNINNFSLPAEKFELTLLRLPAEINGIFDVIFMDPPYQDSKIITQQINTILLNQNITKGGFLILECDAKYILPEFEKLDLVLQRKMSERTKLIFWQAI